MRDVRVEPKPGDGFKEEYERQMRAPRDDWKTISDRVEAARRSYDAMTPEQRIEHDIAQQESFAGAALTTVVVGRADVVKVLAALREARSATAPALEDKNG